MPREKQGRNYESPVREAQAEQTRQRILDATLRVLARGASAFTVPAVAKEAEVSLPTVYRLYPNKQELAAAARLEVQKRVGIDRSPVATLDELLARQVMHMRSVAEMDDALVKSLFDLSAQPLSKQAAASAQATVSNALKLELKGVRGKERQHLINTISMFFSSAGAMMFWRHRLLNEEGAETFTWVVNTLVDAVRKNQRNKS